MSQLPTVIWVDSDLNVANSGLIIQDAGYQFKFFNDTQKAISYIKTHINLKYYVGIISSSMKQCKQNGIQMLDEIKSFQSSMKCIPIFAICSTSIKSHQWINIICNNRDTVQIQILNEIKKQSIPPQCITIDPYQSNHPRNNDIVLKEGKRLINEIPILKDLERQNIISSSHQFNSISIIRNEHEQKEIANKYGGGVLPRYMSGAFKFALVNKKAPPPDSKAFVAFHGNINGKGIKGICTNGLRGYKKDSYTIAHGTSHLGHTLVSPSWKLALECYGFEYIPPRSNYRYRIALQTRVMKSAKIINHVDTFNGYELDMIVSRNTMEWSVISGVVIKMYYTKKSVGRLNKHNLHPFRKMKMKQSS